MPFTNQPQFPGAILDVAHAYNWKNALAANPVPSLAAAMLATDTSATLTAGTGQYLPTDNFPVTIDSEVMFVASRSVDTLSSLTRGAEGTTAAAHAINIKVEHFITAQHLNQIAADLNSIQGFIPAWQFNPDQAPTPPGSLDDEFPGTALSAAWTQLNMGTATATVAKSHLLLQDTAHPGALRLLYKTAPATPWTVRGKLSAGAPNAGIYILAGLALADVTNGHFLTWGPGASGATWNFELSYWSSLSAIGAYLFELTHGMTWAMSYWQLQDDATNLNFAFSPDGLNYFTLYSESRTAHFAAGPTAVGLCLGIGNNTATYIQALTCDWFRRTQ